MCFVSISHPCHPYSGTALKKKTTKKNWKVERVYLVHTLFPCNENIDLSCEIPNYTTRVGLCVCVCACRL